MECFRTRGEGCVDPRRDSPAPVQPLHSGSSHNVICFPRHVTSACSAVATGWGVHAGAQVQAQALTQEEALVQGEPSRGQGNMHSASLAHAIHYFKCRIISFDPLSTSVENASIVSFISQKRILTETLSDCHTYGIGQMMSPNLLVWRRWGKEGPGKPNIYL